MRWFTRWYGANPLHLLTMVGCFALAGYAADKLPPHHAVALPGPVDRGAIEVHEGWAHVELPRFEERLAGRRNSYHSRVVADSQRHRWMRCGPGTQPFDEGEFGATLGHNPILRARGNSGERDTSRTPSNSGLFGRRFNGRDI